MESEVEPLVPWLLPHRACNQGLPFRDMGFGLCRWGLCTGGAAICASLPCCQVPQAASRCSAQPTPSLSEEGRMGGRGCQGEGLLVLQPLLCPLLPPTGGWPLREELLPSTDWGEAILGGAADTGVPVIS